jgi:hypothetical protein
LKQVWISNQLSWAYLVIVLFVIKYAFLSLKKKIVLEWSNSKPYMIVVFANRCLMLWQ